MAMKVQVLNIDPSISGQRLLTVGRIYTVAEKHWRSKTLMSVGIKVGKQTVALWADQLSVISM